MNKSRRLPGKLPCAHYFRRAPQLILFILLAVLGSCGEGETTRSPAATAPASQPSAPDFIVAGFMNDAAALQRGQDLFLGSCVSFCHGLIEEEPDQADALFLFDCRWTHTEDNAGIFRIIKEGIPDTRMVGFGENFPEGDGDVWKIIAYIRQSQDNCGEVSR